MRSCYNREVSPKADGEFEKGGMVGQLDGFFRHVLTTRPDSQDTSARDARLHHESIMTKTVGMGVFGT